MRTIRNYSIRIKLVFLMATVVGVVLILAGTVLVLNERQMLRYTMAERFMALADVVGDNCAVAVDLADLTGPADCERILSSLRVYPTVDFACLYNANEHAIATYRQGAARNVPPELPRTIGRSYFQDGHLHVFRHITLDDATIGTIYLRGSLDQLNAQLRRNVVALAVVLAASLAAVMLLVSLLQRFVTEPIRRLADATGQVTRNADYSIRVEKQADDELGVLCDGFNSMLAQIQSRDRELEEYRAGLEEQVRVRTEHLEVKTNELERSNRDLDDFAYIASHDLKEPLRGIANYATFLAEDYADKIDNEGRDKIDTLKRLCQRMDDLIDSLLMFSRVGRAELAIQPTDLNQLVSDIVDSIHVTLEEQRVEVRIPRSLPTITCDAVRVRELYRNLITNAIKYNDKQEKWIELGFEEPDDVGNSSPPTFYVRDNGIGIRDKHLDSIFRIFKRLHARDKYGGGTGVGLTFVKKIAERHGGRVWIESEYGEGSTFFFTLRGNANESCTADAE